MRQMTKQTDTQNTQLENNTAKRIVGVVFGIIEVILAFRFIFKLFGADETIGFVKFIYAVAGFFMVMYKGIFPQTNVGTKGFLEPATLIAMVVIALIAWVV